MEGQATNAYVTKYRVTLIFAGSSHNLSDDTDLCTGVDMSGFTLKITDDKAWLKPRVALVIVTHTTNLPRLDSGSGCVTCSSKCTEHSSAASVDFIAARVVVNYAVNTWL